jgi:hypothetical protein
MNHSTRGVILAAKSFLHPRIYISEDYSDAARQLSGQAYGGAGKARNPTFNSTEFYHLEVSIRRLTSVMTSDLHFEMNDSVLYRRDKETPVGFTLPTSCDGVESASQRN